MAIWIVTRHPGAADFAKGELRRLGLATQASRFIELDHVTDDDLRDMAGGVVVGVLPIQHIARLTDMGTTVYAIVLPHVPPDARGKELTVDQMRQYGAKLARVTATYQPLD